MLPAQRNDVASVVFRTPPPPCNAYVFFLCGQVYRLITRRTYEAVMFERASMKLGLEQAVLCQARDKGPSTVRAALEKNISWHVALHVC